VERYNTFGRTGVDVNSAEFDAGLRKHMLKVYNLMASGVLLTAVISLLLTQNPDMLASIFQSGLGTVAMFAPLGIILIMSFAANSLSSGVLQALFWALAVSKGISLSPIMWQFVQNDPYTLARTFFITAAAFGGLSLYGYTTKKSLSGMGTFLFMGLIGLIIASIVNVFVGSGMLSFVISVAGVLVFSGLIAYDTQNIKESYYMMQTGEMADKGAIFGAVSLYINFINLFLFLLNLFGGSDD